MFVCKGTIVDVNGVSIEIGKTSVTCKDTGVNGTIYGVCGCFVLIMMKEKNECFWRYPESKWVYGLRDSNDIQVCRSIEKYIDTKKVIFGWTGISCTDIDNNNSFWEV